MASDKAALKPVIITAAVLLGVFHLMVVLPLLYTFRRDIWKFTKRLFTHGTCKCPDDEQGQGIELGDDGPPQLHQFAWEIRPDLPTHAPVHGVHIPGRAHVRQVPASPPQIVPAHPQKAVLPKTFMDKVAERTVPAVPNHVMHGKQFVGRHVPNASDPSAPPRSTESRFVESL